MRRARRSAFSGLSIAELAVFLRLSIADTESSGGFGGGSVWREAAALNAMDSTMAMIIYR